MKKLICPSSNNTPPPDVTPPPTADQIRLLVDLIFSSMEMGRSLPC